MWKFRPELVQKRFEKNLTFLKQHMPSLWQRLKDVELNEVTLSFNTKTNKLDLLNKGQSYYLGDCESYIEREVEEFAQQFRPGAPIKTLLPITQNYYSGPRFFHAHLNKTIQQTDQSKMSREHFYLTESIPMIVFMGIGTGLHIEEYLSKRECQVVIIQETNIELIYSSMYLTDWYKIIPKFHSSNDKYFNFVLNSSKNEAQVFHGIWNELIRYSPIFPALSIFYNHRKSAFSDRIIQKIQEEFKVYITAWGFYDDEINQFNNARHNLRHMTPILPQRLSTQSSLAARNGAAVIVGAGPSLNNKISWIKENRESIVLFSCGTALSILKHNDIMPDIHVEIESDYATVLHLKHTLSDTYCPPLLVGAIQLNPKVFQQFQRKVMFFKDSTALYELFGKHCAAQLNGMTPTCTNAGMSLAIQLGFTSLYLFGTDFGYKREEDSHAEGSVYFDKSAPDYLQQVGKNRSGAMLVTDINGELIRTEPIYNAARDRIEKMIDLHQNRISVFNCSEGAFIKGTSIIKDKESFHSKIKDSMRFVDYPERLFYESTVLTRDEVTEGKNTAKDYLSQLSNTITEYLDQMSNDKESFLYTLLRISHMHENFFRKNRNTLYFFTRGSLWHYLNTGISLVYACQSEEVARENMKIWSDGFKEFLELWPKHFEWASNKSEPVDDDDWLNSRITECVSDPFYEQVVS